MTSHPFSPWLSLVRAALPALQQAGAEVPALRAQYAQGLKSTLALGRDLAELQGAACAALLQAQLGMIGATSPVRTAQALVDVQFDTMSQWYAQWKALSDQAVARTDTCIDDLRQAQTQDDVTFVMAAFLRESQAGMRKAGEDAALLLKSAGTATGVLAERLLDELIAQPGAAATPPAQDA